VIVAGLALTPRAHAHDLWIEPSAFTPQAGRIVGVRLRVGQDFIGDPVARDAALIEEFVAMTSTGALSVPGQDGADPAGLIRPTTNGLVILSYRSHPSAIVLPADKFNQYLQDEGLDAVIRERARVGLTSQPAHELFARCAKSLIQTGPPTTADVDRALGMRLELIAGRNPYTLHAGDSLNVRLLYQERPLAGALVVALNRRDQSATVRLRTGPDGCVRLPLGAAGPWLVKAVHMIPAPRDSDAEWQSFWASLTFELPAADPPGRP
jgi:uncharacterized GH25 family protein